MSNEELRICKAKRELDNGYQRDYDKNPLILNNYEEFFSISIIFTILISCILDFYMLDFAKEYLNIFLQNEEELKRIISDFEVNNNILMICVVAYIFVYVIDYKNNTSKVEFKNKVVNFIKDEEVVNTTEITKEKLFVSASPLGFYFNADVITKIVVLVLMMFCLYYFFNIFICIKAIIFFITASFMQILFNFFHYILLNSTFKGAKLCPFFYVNSLNSERVKLSRNKHRYRYNFIFIYNEEVYKELKEYFLITQNIDVDKIKKWYFLCFY